MEQGISMFAATSTSSSSSSSSSSLPSSSAAVQKYKSSIRNNDPDAVSSNQPRRVQDFNYGPSGSLPSTSTAAAAPIPSSSSSSSSAAFTPSFSASSPPFANSQNSKKREALTEITVAQAKKEKHKERVAKRTKSDESKVDDNSKRYGSHKHAKTNGATNADEGHMETSSAHALEDGAAGKLFAANSVLRSWSHSALVCKFT
jgi:hypothetical protein